MRAVNLARDAHPDGGDVARGMVRRGRDRLSGDGEQALREEIDAALRPAMPTPIAVMWREAWFGAAAIASLVTVSRRCVKKLTPRSGCVRLRALPAISPVSRFTTAA
jgi:hypothetical protein